MISIHDYLQHDALSLANLVKSKEVSAEELLTTAISLCEKYNPTLNAVIYKMYELAKENIKYIDINSVFSGVPFLLKDLGTFYQGTPSTFGSYFYKDFIADFDSEITSRFKRAGLNIFGKTNTPEFGMSYTTESKLLGACHNPWDLTRTPGGSSGGAAAAVAARIIPMAHASDGGGSIRVPASCCGLFGLKPSRARISHAPAMGEGWSGMSTGGVISISVRDTAAILDCISGYVDGDPYCSPEKNISYLEKMYETPRPLKIAYCFDAPNFVNVDKDCKDAVTQTLRYCEVLGYKLVEAKPDFDFNVIQNAISIIVSANLVNMLKIREKKLNRRMTKDDIELRNYYIALAGEKFTAADYANAIFTMHAESRKISHFFRTFDIFISPVLAKIPIKVETTFSGIIDPNNLFQEMLETAPFTSIWNMTGQPAMSVPLYWTKENLPIGVQFVAKFGDEITLLQLARQFEEIAPWQHKIPALIK